METQGLERWQTEEHLYPQWHCLGRVPPEHLMASPQSPHSLSENRVRFLDEEPEAPIISEGSGAQGLQCSLFMFFPCWLLPGKVMYNSLGGSVFPHRYLIFFRDFLPICGKVSRKPSYAGKKNICPGLGQWATAGQVT